MSERVLIPEGTDYQVTIVGKPTVGAAGTGTPMISFNVKVPYNGFTYDRTIPVYLSEKSWEHAMAKLKYVGVDPSDLDNITYGEGPFRASCKHEPGQKDATKIYEKWDFYQPKASNAAPIVGEERKRLAAQLKAGVGTVPPPKTPPPPAPKSSGPPPVATNAVKSTATRDECWTQCVEFAKVNNVDAATVWAAKIAEVESKLTKQEALWGPTEYGVLYAKFIPF